MVKVEQYELTRVEGLAVDELHVYLNSMVNGKEPRKAHKQYREVLQDLRQHITETREFMEGRDVFYYIVSIMNIAYGQLKEDKKWRESLYLNGEYKI